jgi:GDP-L-fucose synthase
MCWAYNRQYGTRNLAVMPTNLYGPGDNYDAQTSHVLPALIRKIHEAKTTNASEVSIWGSGQPRREFLYSDDAADACIFLMNLPDEAFDQVMNAAPSSPPLINIGTGEDQTIAALARLIGEVLGYRGGFSFDPTKPDGTPRKLLCVDRMRALGWVPRIALREGIRLAYFDYLTGLT